jgi:hypothetical protein
MRPIQLAPSVRSVFSEDGAVLMNIQQGMMYTSNPVGGRILELLSQGLPESDVVEIISRECEAAQETVRHDVEVFIQQLQSYGIVCPQTA